MKKIEIKEKNTGIMWTSLTFKIKFHEDTILQSYPINTFRGGLGYVFKDLLSVNERMENDSLKFNNKIYEDLFGIKKNGKVLENTYVGYVKPFCIQMDNIYKRSYVKGEPLILKLNLFGNAIDYFHYFIAAFKRLGELGLGKNKVKFDIIEVTSNHPQNIVYKIYDGRIDSIIGSPVICHFEEIVINQNSLPANSLELEFLSPTRIKIGGKLTLNITFPDLIDNLIRKIKSINYFHHEEGIDSGIFQELIDLSFDIEVVRSSLKWKSINRYSTRQKTFHVLNGFVGHIQFSGNLTPFLPILYLGQYLHLGKQSTFGLGQYKMKVSQIENNNDINIAL